MSLLTVEHLDVRLGGRSILSDVSVSGTDLEARNLTSPNQLSKQLRRFRRVPPAPGLCHRQGEHLSAGAAEGGGEEGSAVHAWEGKRSWAGGKLGVAGGLKSAAQMKMKKPDIQALKDAAA